MRPNKIVTITNSRRGHHVAVLRALAQMATKGLSRSATSSVKMP
jgi:hypothetical protein